MVAIHFGLCVLVRINVAYALASVVPLGGLNSSFTDAISVSAEPWSEEDRFAAGWARFIPGNCYAN